jgi:putative copper export protein
VARRRTIESWTRPLAATAAGVAMVAGLWVGTNWRLALIAALAAGAIALTRLRYAAITAVAFLAITLIVAQTGHTAGSDERDVVSHGSNR